MDTTGSSVERIVVAGATGYLGRYLVHEFRTRGFDVRALVRSIDRAHTLGRNGAPTLANLGIDFQIVDVEDPMSIHGLLNPDDRIVSSLGVTSQKANPWDVDFRGNLALLAECERVGCRSMLYVGALGIERGSSAVQRAKFAFTEVLKRSSIPSQIIHPSGYFSDLANALTMVNRGMKIQVGDGSIRMNPIHGADLASFCADRIRTEGEWKVGGPDILTYREILDLAASALNRHPREISVSEGALEIGTRFAPRVSKRAGNFAEFFTDMMTHDAVGERTGTHTVAQYFVDQAQSIKTSTTAQ